MADNYILKESWGKPNIQSREYLAQQEQEKDAMLAKGGIVVGDKVYVIESKKTYVLGFDNKWYDASEGGAAPVLEDVTVSYTENDTYTITPSSGYDGIAQVDVTVDVPSDPSLEELDVTYLENGNYIITPTAGIDGISQANVFVNVPAPPAIVEPKTVTLYDYDGTIITQYGAQEFAALQNYPAAPVHEGLTFQSWNWPLENAKQYVAKYKYCDIGATYCTSDGFTKLYLALESGADSMEVNFSLEGEGSIDWGDGTSTHITGDSLETNLSERHTYATTGGYYIIKIGVTGVFSLGGYENTAVWQGYGDYGDLSLYKVELASNAILGGGFNCENTYQSALSSIVISEGTTALCSSAFCNCNSLKHVTVPRTTTVVGNYSFAGMYSLKSISLSYQCNIDDNDCLIGDSCCITRLVIPEGNTVLSNFGVSYDLWSTSTALSLITVPDTITQINSIPFISKITIPSGVTTINSLTGCLSSINIPSSVNTLEDNACDGNPFLQKAIIGAKYVGGNQFHYTSGLYELTFTSNVESIGSELFYEYGHNNVHILTFEGTTPPTLASDSFTYLPTTCIIRVPQGSLSAYTSAENYPDPNTYTYEEY
jgi:hypothetical protein